MRHHQTLRITQGLWRVTFRIRLPNIDIHDERPVFNSSMFNSARFVQLSRCAPLVVKFQQKDAHCARFVNNVAFIRKTAIRAQRTLNTLSGHIRNNLPRQLPHNWHEDKNIKPRSLLPIISDFGKSLFGFATDSDLQSVKLAVNELIKNHNIQENTLKSSAKHLASFASNVNTHFDNILEKINNNEAQTLSLLEQVSNASETGVNFLSNITLNTLEVMSSIQEMENYFSNFLSGVETLATGRLPVLLIPQDKLNETLFHVTDTLKAMKSEWQVINTDTIFYYTKGAFVHVRDATHLYITLQIPLSWALHPFNIFELIIVPLPTHDGKHHATRLIGLPDAVAIEKSEEHMFFLTSHELAEIDQTHQSHVRRTFQRATQDQCVMALYHDAADLVMKHCKFQIEIDSKPNAIHQLGEQEFLLVNIEAYDIHGPKGTVKHEGCTSCIITLGPGERLDSPNYVITPTLKDNPFVPPVRHVTNLALLHALLEDAKTLMSASNYQTDETEINAPNISMYKNNLTHKDSSIDKTNLDLKKAVQYIKNDEQIASSLTHAMLLQSDEDGSMKFWLSIPGFLLEGLSAWTLLLSILILTLTISVRKLHVAVVILQAVTPQADANKLIFNVMNQTPPPAAKASLTLEEASEMTTIQWVLTTLTVVAILTWIILVLYALCRCWRNNTLQQKFDISILLISERRTIVIDLLELVGLPEDYAFASGEFIKDIRVTGCLKGTLTYNWPSFEAKNALETTFKLSGSAKLKFGQAAIVRLVLKTKFVCIPVFKVNNRFQRFES